MVNNGKAKIEKTFNELKIIIPSEKNWFFQIFGTAWMGGWFFGFIMVSEKIFFSEISYSGANLFVLFWLIAWTVGGLIVARALLWGYFGQEKFMTDRSEVFFEKTVFGMGKKMRLDISEIKNFRVEIIIDSESRRKNDTSWGLGGGKIKFDYGLKTYSFGLSVDDAEAEYIVGLLKEQFKEQ